MTDRKIEAGDGRRIGDPAPVSGSSDSTVNTRGREFEPGGFEPVAGSASADTDAATAAAQTPTRLLPSPYRLLGQVAGAGSAWTADVRTMIDMGERRQDDAEPTPTPFYPVTITGEGPFEVTINPGAVGFWNPKADSDTLTFQEPTLNGQDLAADPAPILNVASGEWVVVKVEVDGRNQSKSVPTIEIGEQDGTHYVPQAGDTNAADGVYYIKLFKIDKVGDEIILDHRVWTDPIICPYLWTGTNEGFGVGRVLKDFKTDDARYRFRTLARQHGVKVEEVGDSITHQFDAENVGDDGVPIYIEPEDPIDDQSKAQFRKIAGRPSPDIQQIRTRAPANPDGPAIVEGNGKVGNFIITKNGAEAGRTTWDDGLITVNGDITIEVCCVATEAPGP